MTLRTTTGRVRLGATLAATTMLVWGVLPLALKVVLRSLDSPTIIWFRMGVSAWTIGGAATVVGGSLLVALGGRSCLTLSTTGFRPGLSRRADCAEILR
jgi:hypothetical protein